MPLEEAKRMWTEHYDDSSGYPYYVNSATGETSWEAPPGLRGGGGGAAGAAAVVAVVVEEEEEEKDMSYLNLDADNLNPMAMKGTDRQRVLGGLMEKRQAAYRIKLEAEEAAARKAIEDLWVPQLRAARSSLSFTLCWKNLDVMHDGLFEPPLGTTLESLRLIGHAFDSIPLRLASTLCGTLRALNLCANQLTELPDNIGLLCCLTDLDVSKNMLVALPNAIGDLVNLTRLEVASNNITELPTTIGNLCNIPRLRFEGNALSTIPLSFGELRCSHLSLSLNPVSILRNDIVTSLGHTLVSLSINSCGLTELPEAIGELKCLKALSACNNAIMRIPVEICELTGLESFWLDWNGVDSLPRYIWKMTSLRSLKLEGCPILIPPPETMHRGAAAVVAWARENDNLILVTHKRHLIQKLQAICKACERAKLLPPQFFEGHGEGYHGDGYEYFNFPMEELGGTIIAAHRAAAAAGTVRRIPFSHSVEDVEDALTTYSDGTGTTAGFLDEPAFFRRCGCLDPSGSGERRVCVPPKPGWQCKRIATYVRRVLHNADEHAAHEMNAQSEERRLAARVRAEAAAKTYCESDEGVTRMGNLALEVTDKETRDEARQKKVAQTTTKLKGSHDKAMAVLHRKRDKLEAAKAKRVTKLQEKKASMKRKMAHVTRWEQDRLKAQITEIDAECADMPEDEKLGDLKMSEEEALEKYNAEIAKAGAWEPNALERALGGGSSLSKAYANRVRRTTRRVIAEYIERKGTEAMAHVAREHELMRKSLFMWRQRVIVGFYHRWAQWTKDRIELRFHLAERSLRQRTQALEEREATRELRNKEMEKWIPCTDPVSQNTYYQHAESKEVRWDRPERNFRTGHPRAPRR